MNAGPFPLNGNRQPPAEEQDGFLVIYSVSRSPGLFPTCLVRPVVFKGSLTFSLEIRILGNRSSDTCLDLFFQPNAKRLVLLPSCCEYGLSPKACVFFEGGVVNMLGSEGHVRSVTASHLCSSYRASAFTGDTSITSDVVALFP